MSRRRVPLLDVLVTPMGVEELLAEISGACARGCGLLIAGHNLHSVYLHHTDAEFARFYRDCEVVLIDGMPVLMALGLAGGRRPPRRMRLGSTDWIHRAAELSEVERIVVLGASRRSNAGLAAQLGDRAEVLGIPGDPWRAEDLEDALTRIIAHDPQLVLIGMGMPLQERIARELRRRARPMTIATVGGAIDQLSGAQALAPRWVGRLGGEWLWRLVRHPRRLAGRYLVEPVRLTGVLLGRRG